MTPMTRASGFGPLPALLEQRAGERALHRVFAAESVPLQSVTIPDLMIPIDRMTAIFERAARAVGDATFGLDVGDAMSLGDFGIWGEYCATAPTLDKALKRTIAARRYHQPGSRVWIQRKRDVVVWNYLPAVSGPHTQHTDHIVAPFCGFVRSLCGPDWAPVWIAMNYPRDARAPLLEERFRCPVYFGSPTISIAIATCHMDRPNPMAGTSERHLTLLDIMIRSAAAKVAEPVGSILSIIQLRLLEGHSDIDGTAQMAGLGVQTLQRRLRAEGVAYRALVDMARSNRARSLLRDSELSVMEIGLSLGYSDYANFARAFRRWTDRTPSAFRRASA